MYLSSHTSVTNQWKHMDSMGEVHNFYIVLVGSLVSLAEGSKPGITWFTADIWNPDEVYHRVDRCQRCSPSSLTSLSHNHG